MARRMAGGMKGSSHERSNYSHRRCQRARGQYAINRMQLPPILGPSLAKAAQLLKKFGFNVENVVAAAKSQITLHQAKG